MRLTSILRKICPSSMGPIKTRLRNAKDTLYFLPENKVWYCGGYRSAAIAAELILKGNIVALPTDTVYGLAGLAQNNKAIAKLYTIKERDESKPLAICLCDIEDIEKWAHTEDLPPGLTDALLPGPTTLVLKRKNTLNPQLNPGVPNVGVRIPRSDFVRSVAKMVNAPLALTSANKSQTRSSLHPSEFEDLWPELDGVFYEKINTGGLRDWWRSGSTVVDLTVKGEYRVIRQGIGYLKTVRILKKFDLKRPEKQKSKKKAASEDEESVAAEDEKVVKAQASG